MGMAEQEAERERIHNLAETTRLGVLVEEEIANLNLPADHTPAMPQPAVAGGQAVVPQPLTEAQQQENQANQKRRDDTRAKITAVFTRNEISSPLKDSPE